MQDAPGKALGIGVLKTILQHGHVDAGLGGSLVNMCAADPHCGDAKKSAQHASPLPKPGFITCQNGVQDSSQLKVRSLPVPANRVGGSHSLGEC